jgi:hypothetical protein
MKPPAVTLRELNRWTLARQLLLARADLDPVTAIERLGGLQAQWPRSPYIALWSRLGDFRAEDLEAVLGSGRVVKSTLMRMTLHLVSAAHFHLLRAALDHAGRSGWGHTLALAGDELAGLSVALLGRAGEGALPRAEALRIIAARLPSMEELDTRRLWYLLKSEGLVNDPARALFRSAPNGDHVPAPPGAAVEPGAAVAHLVRTHLSAFGPATRADTSDWSGQLVGSLAPGYAALSEELVEFTGPDGELLFDLREAPRPSAETEAPVRFLAKWDSLLLGHKRRTRVIGEAERKVVIRKNGDVTESFTVDGFVAGTWVAMAKRGAASLRLTPFAPLDAAALVSLEEEGVRLLRFLLPEASSTEVDFD